MSKITAQNLKSMLENKGVKQYKLAEGIGYSNVSVSKWVNGGAISPDARTAIIDYLGCTEQDLMGYSDGYYAKSTGMNLTTPSIEPIAATTTAPVAGSIAAGDPSEAIEWTDERHYIPPEILAADPDTFILRLHGDSMNLILPDGCFVAVCPNLEVKSGDIAAVKVNGDDATVKRIKFVDDLVLLIPESTNPEHKVRLIDENDPDAPYFSILGRVPWCDYELVKF